MLAGGIALAAGLASQAHAATFSVTATGDAGPDTLRATIDAATSTPGSPHTVVFDLPANSVIELDSVLPSMPGVTLTLDGIDVPGLEIDGGGASRLFDQAAGSSLTLRHLILRDGVASDGGGCIRTSHTATSLIVDHVEMSGCIAADPSGIASGGAILAHGPLFVYDSHFHDNRARSSTAAAYGGAIRGLAMTWVEDSSFEDNRVDSDDAGVNGGAIHANARLTVLRSQFQRNTADQPGQFSFGGAIGITSNALATIRQSLFLRNVGWHGSAIHAARASSDATTTVIASNNTIAGNRGSAAVYLWNIRLDLKNNSFWKNQGSVFVAHLLVHGQATEIAAASNNLFAATAAGEPSCRSYDHPGGLFGHGSNLFVDHSCDFIDDFSVVTTDDLRIRGLRRTGTGHDIPVVDLFAGSPAIDGGHPLDVGSGQPYACVAGDARDESRPADGDADGEATCDIGALEIQREASLFADDFEVMLLQ